MSHEGAVENDRPDPPTVPSPEPSASPQGDGDPRSHDFPVRIGMVYEPEEDDYDSEDCEGRDCDE